MLLREPRRLPLDAHRFADCNDLDAPETTMNTADHYTAHNDRVMLCPLCNKTHTVTAQDSAADEDGPVDAESAVVTAHYRLEILARLDAPFKLFAPREKPSAPARAVTTRRRTARR